MTHLREFKSLKLLVRSMMYLAACSSLFCAFIVLVIGNTELIFLNYVVVYYSIFTLLFSILAIAFVSVYYQIKKQLVWENVKKEVMLIFIAIGILSILSIILNF